MGPSLGILRHTDVLAPDGSILGLATKPAPPPYHGSLVVEMDSETHVGAQYGLADGSGYVFPAKMTRISDQVIIQDIENSVGNTDAVGRLAWKPNSGERNARVLVMGGTQRARDRFLRWYTETEFAYEQRISQISAEKNTSEGSKSKIADLMSHDSQLQKMSMSFKIISSILDPDREETLKELQKKELELLRSSIIPEIAVGENLLQNTSRFRSADGENQNVSRVVENHSNLQFTWPLLTEAAALSLLYWGATASSPLSEYGRLNDFLEGFSNRVKTRSGDDDACRYFTGEILLSKRDQSFPEIYRPPHSMVLVNAPDIVDNVGISACGRAVWLSLGHAIPKILEMCRSADLTKSKTVSRSKFIELSSRLRPAGNEADALKLLDLLVIDESGRVEYEGLQNLFNNAETQLSAYDQVAAFLEMGAVNDVIIVLLDGNRSRFNDTELEILKQLNRKYKHKMHIACVDNHSQLSDLRSRLVEELQDPTLANVVNVGGDWPATLDFINGAINMEQTRLLSLLSSLRFDVDNLLRRLEYLYARSQPAIDDEEHSDEPIVDAHAVAAANAILVQALRHSKSLLGATHGQPLLDQLRVTLAATKHLAVDLLARSACAALDHAERCERWEAVARRQEVVKKAAQELAVEQWVTAAHVDSWLENVGVSRATRAAFRKSGIKNVQALLTVDAAAMNEWGVALRDRVRILRGLEAVRRRFKEGRAHYAQEGLWQLVVCSEEPVIAKRGDGLALSRTAMEGAAAKGLIAGSTLVGILRADCVESEDDDGTRIARQAGMRRVRIEPALLYDQGPGMPPVRGGYKQGDKVIVEAQGHGRVLVTVPGRAELEQSGFEMLVDVWCGGGGYTTAEDVGLMYGVLNEQALQEHRSGEAHGLAPCVGRADSGGGSLVLQLLEDALDMLMTGDAPPALVAEVVAHVRARLDVSGRGEGGGAVDATASGLHEQSGRDRRGAGYGGTGGIYCRRWAHDAAMAMESVPDSDSDGGSGGEDAELLGRDEAQGLAAAGLDRVFDSVAGGRVTADGARLETALYRDKALLRLLRRVGIRFVPGRVGVLAERDVLRREFVHGVLGIE